MDEDRPAHALYYDDDLVANLQLRWGAGFMSPGGRAELAHMIRGVDLSGREGLDFGCGVGGYDRLLVTEHGAAAVYGIDLGAAVVAEAQDRAEAEGPRRSPSLPCGRAGLYSVRGRPIWLCLLEGRNRGSAGPRQTRRASRSLSRHGSIASHDVV
jgi:SAM-dependent methyltransferase